MSPSPLFFTAFVLLIVFLCASAAASSTTPSDVTALKALKAAINPSTISPWSCLASWNFSAADPCTLPRRTHFVCGVACTSDTGLPSSSAIRITAITLDPAGYSGVLTPLLSNLSALTHLDVSGNNFHGPIPSSLSSLSSLQTLTLSSNSFTGPFSFAAGSLSSLVSLDVSRNDISGSLPENMGFLVSLRVLDASFNSLSGPIPRRLPPNLVELALRGNRLSGILPRPSFETLRYLEVVELAGNALEGRVEGWLLRLPSVQQIDLANNSFTHFQVWNSEGRSSSNRASRVVAVDLGFNKIEGYLPAELAGFPLLAALSVRHNHLKGGIPWEYCGSKKGCPFRRLFLDGNFLNGKVPTGLVAGGGVSGSLGDNCLDSCPSSAPLCAPSQKPPSLCKQVYGMDTRRPRPSPSSSP